MSIYVHTPRSRHAHSALDRVRGLLPVTAPRGRAPWSPPGGALSILAQFYVWLPSQRSVWKLCPRVLSSTRLYFLVHHRAAFIAGQYPGLIVPSLAGGTWDVSSSCLLWTGHGGHWHACLSANAVTVSLGSLLRSGNAGLLTAAAPGSPERQCYYPTSQSGRLRRREVER